MDQTDYDRAKQLLAETHSASISFMQRKLGLSYEDAFSIMSRFEREGLVSPPDGIGRRVCLLPPPSS